MQNLAPAPIFNQRKRQRQAIFADINPGQPATNPCNTTSSKTSLMPVGGYSGVRGGGSSSSRGGLNKSNRGHFTTGKNYNQTENSTSFNQPSSICDGFNQTLYVKSEKFNKSQQIQSQQGHFNQFKNGNSNVCNRSIQGNGNQPNSVNINQSSNNSRDGFYQTQSNTRGGFKQSSITHNNRGDFNQVNNNFNRANFNSNPGSNVFHPISSNNRGNIIQSNSSGLGSGDEFKQSCFGSNFGNSYEYSDFYSPSRDKYKKTEVISNQAINQYQQNNRFGNFHGNQGVTKVNNFDGRFQKAPDFGHQNTPSRGKTLSSSGNIYSTGSGPNPLNWGTQVVKQPQTSMFDNSSQYQSTTQNYGYYPMSFNQSLNGKSLNTSINTQEQPKHNEIDKSLKLITTDIEGVKRWGQVKTNFILLFEIFGMVDSAVLMNAPGTGKEFILNDGSASIQCLFYEIDRELQRLVRGQWHRCVGSLQMRSGKMKCVAIRPASAEERKTAKITAAVSERWLQHFTKSFNEQ
ncbi:GATA zinc finger domain-containing protein 14 [Patella vulgata]|uniref:GATA zinc finger domain-containing protein 14 n=1 Tax=Patella vulgata TaxID=6465 RepID=UPI0024A9917A|nr:GATA zinc finger domain-containing protein 14 [Patella vulgata]XP_055957808.1 GATA zinc finger domain-containing protein 14 [Patella vulgata]